MCVILHLIPGGTIPEEFLFNAAANNWHSWGIGIRKPGNKLQVIKRMPKNGVHTELKRIKQLLKNNEEHERILHFRFNTRGETSLDNAHPFLALDDEDRKVYFAHNGTFLKYGSVGKADSDTKDYVDTFLTPALESWITDRGYGDYQDDFFKRHILTPGWDNAGGNCRGILFSDDLDTLRIGSWLAHDENGVIVTDTEKNRDSIAFWASNAQYFRAIERGPIHEERKRKAEEERKAREASEVRPASTAQVSGVTHNGRRLDPLNKDKFKADPEVFAALTQMFQDIDIQNDACLSDLAFVTYEEWLKVCDDLAEKNELTAIANLLEHLTIRFNSIFSEKTRLESIRKVG